MTALIALPAIVNAAVVMGLAPTKGFTLPFLSYGGNSLIVCALAVGILLRLGSARLRRSPENRRGRRAPAGLGMMAAARLRWVVAGGGTGGHVTPALALAERIAARGDEVLLLGTERGLESRLVPEAGFELLTLPARQLTGQGLVAQLAAGPALSRPARRPGARWAGAASIW